MRRRKVYIGMVAVILLSVASSVVAGGDSGSKTLPADATSSDAKTQSAAIESVLAERTKLIGQLSQVLTSPSRPGRTDHRKARATYLLGKLRAPEGVPVLVKLIDKDFIGPLKRRPHGMANPTGALIQIGKPAIPALLAACKATDDADLAWAQLMVLGHILGGRDKTQELLKRVRRGTKDKAQIARLDRALRMVGKWKEDTKPLY